MDPGQWRQWFRIDDTAGSPLFEQIRTQIVDGVRSGALAPGTRLPTVRDLAAELGLAVNTVARAYRELETAGVVETRRRFGTFIARTDPTDATLAAAAARYAEAVRGLGLGRAEALAYVAAAFDGANSSSVNAPRSQSSSGS
ncbi:GntR family transcriptional regulator [Mycolicibacillus parakoreensis]|uniref:GntR family transcriptional regulator n=1 Tax=Mycolicibacillus parakoreensis TaxID=1069221 RepID=A0ABY3U0T4_9MYCO|nr:GntR family transcriptional regulator [Mycolicibacillus parakoreensis]MCV7315063.1 GntR family transcriptional regulator [Mycolicibacillus parakoreensis]ULN53583.1 GntR family transcriptional regulator [Mycolicibacillus parakoreensis]